MGKTEERRNILIECQKKSHHNLKKQGINIDVKEVIRYIRNLPQEDIGDFFKSYKHIKR